MLKIPKRPKLERNWHGTIPIYINNFNQFTTVKAMAEYFSTIEGTEVIVVDNNSTYPPLLEWYKSTNLCTVKMLGRNGGHQAPWRSGVILGPQEQQKKYGSIYYVVTDADLDITRCPKDLINVLVEGKINHKVAKVGLSIEINDLPDGCPSKNAVVRWEGQYWGNRTHYKTKNGTGFHHANTDTTFALYKNGEHGMTISPAIRADRPYTAKHKPWYITKENIDDEYKFIINLYPNRSSNLDRQDWIIHLKSLL